MTDPLQRVRRFLAELRRRKVYRVAVTYVVAAAGAVQLVSVVVPASRLPPWSDEFFVGVAVFGFPLAVILAWAFEVTPEGVRRTETRDDEPSAPPSYRWVALTFALLAAGGSWWFATESSDTQPSDRAADDSASRPAEVTERFPSRDRPFVAVLPFENLSPEEETKYFAAGVHEEILNRLSKVSGIGVFARTTMSQYEDTDRTVHQIGRELGAEAVLEGSVRRARGRVRISAQLIDPESRDHLWSESYERQLSDVFAVQTEIARRVTEELEATLSPEEERRISARPTENTAAYDLYLRGRESETGTTAESNEEAIRLYRKALELDPDFALAWAGLADGYAARVGLYGYSRAWADSAVRAARRAIEIDSTVAEGYAALGISLRVGGEMRDALEAYRRAVELNPDSYDAIRGIGSIYLFLGRFDEAIRWNRRAARLVPDNADPRVTLAHLHKFLRMDEEARAWLERARSLDPRQLLARLLPAQYAIYEGDLEEAVSRAENIVEETPGYAYAWTGAASMAYMAEDFGRAVEWARESLRVTPDNTFLYWHSTKMLLALSLMRSEDSSRGREMLSDRMENYRRRIEAGNEEWRPWRPHWELATAHAALGHREAALDWLERAYEAGFVFARWTPVDPAFDGLREAPRYQRIMNSIEAEVEQMREDLRGTGAGSRRQDSVRALVEPAPAPGRTGRR